MVQAGSCECKDRKIGFLTTRWKHHALTSGYHPIGAGLGPELNRLGKIPSWADWFFAGVFGLPRLAQAANVHRAMQRAHVDALYILNGEWFLKMASSLVRISQVGVGCSFHHCPDELEHRLRKLPSSWIDIAVCVARCQMPLVQRLVKNGRCCFVPHGIDTEAFHPNAWARRDSNLVLSVGAHRRDLRTLCAAARLIRQRRPATRIVQVARLAQLPEGVDASALDIRSDISDAELLSLYQQAAVLLLPLEQSTANNSILEAMASGLPMVTTNVGGVVDYVTPDCARLCALGSVSEHVEHTLALLDDPQRRHAMSLAARANALRFAWPRVREQLRQVLAEWMEVAPPQRARPAELVGAAPIMR
jgi:glycosyltransferase involved in cell wall biosynthesis